MQNYEIAQILTTQKFSKALDAMTDDEKKVLAQWNEAIATGKPIPFLEMTPAISRTLATAMGVACATNLVMNDALQSLVNAAQPAIKVMLEPVAAGATKGS